MITGTATALASAQARRLQIMEPVAEQLPQFNVDLFGALLGDRFGETLIVAVAAITVLAVLVYIFGGVSGGHFNPAVTVALAATRRFPLPETGPYLAAQVAGGVAGAFVVAGMYGQSGAAVGSTDVLFGATVIVEGIGQWQAVLAEAAVGFILMLAIMAVAVDERAPKGFSGLVIGLALGAGMLLTGAVTGGSANFARSLGPYVASLVYDVNRIPWSDLAIYAAGPVVGALAAAFAYESIGGLERVAPAPQPGAATANPEVQVEQQDGP